MNILKNVKYYCEYLLDKLNFLQNRNYQDNNFNYIIEFNITGKKLFFINSYFKDDYNSARYFNLISGIKSLKSNIEIYFPNESNHPPLPLYKKHVSFNSLVKNGGGINYKIFITGENLFGFPEHYLYQKLNLHKTVDLWISFEYNKFSNYIRYPLGILCQFGPCSTYKNVLDFINSVENIRSLQMDRLNYNDKSKLVNIACLIASHDRSNIRSEICDLVSSIDPSVNLIVYAGDFRRNTNDLIDKYNDNKIEFLKNFQFNICPENTDNLGYVTEKLYHALMAGCIPIYWGSGNLPDPDIFNLDRILFYDKDDPNKLLNKIRKLLIDEEHANEFLQQNVFVDKAAEYIYFKILDLRLRMQELGIEFQLDE